LLIESNPPRNCFTVLEIKNIQIDYLVLKGTRTDKAKQLVAMSLAQILKLGLKSENHPPSMEKWLEGDVICKQLRSYVTSATVRAKEKVRAYMVVIIGSRHILIREMDGEGEWTGDWKLVGREQDTEGSGSSAEVDSRQKASGKESAGASEGASEGTIMGVRDGCM